MTPLYTTLKSAAALCEPICSAAHVAAALERFGTPKEKARTLAAFLAQADALTALAAQIREAQTQLEAA